MPVSLQKQSKQSLKNLSLVSKSRRKRPRKKQKLATTLSWWIQNSRRQLLLRKEKSLTRGLKTSWSLTLSKADPLKKSPRSGLITTNKKKHLRRWFRQKSSRRWCRMLRSIQSSSYRSHDHKASSSSCSSLLRTRYTSHHCSVTRYDIFLALQDKIFKKIMFLGSQGKCSGMSQHRPLHRIQGSRNCVNARWIRHESFVSPGSTLPCQSASTLLRQGRQKKNWNSWNFHQRTGKVLAYRRHQRAGKLTNRLDNSRK